MSDTTVEPGAPSAKAVSEATEKAVPKDIDVSKPSSAALAAKKVDQTVLRLNKLLASPGGLSAFLSTFNYTLYTLAYLQSVSPAIAQRARALLSLVKQTSSKPATSTLIADGAVPPIAALAGLISRARTTLRLFGLLPLYAWMKALIAGPKPGSDTVLHHIAVTQCLSYIGYQALENISVLADNGVLSNKFVARINRGDPTTARLYLWAYRAWLSGVSCDFLRLAREAQLEKRRRENRQQMLSEGRAVQVYEDEDAKFDQKWWTDFVVAAAWFPMALHYSSSSGGIPGWNLGWMGLSGLVAGSSRAMGMWRATM
ncbi:hypothetical protein M011DRAFT_483231 [Sporormia fimetaria CBS 119925]|uniref:Peroxin 11C n=1 Tax=Sporormia fimetaria CBS 119925 TaxID=1340428 RepID=A0A6A6VNF9_9PLEO|nr:hypothetical protein M011DRAFT_483231 [Sporormia fimetaria CBS 119925]